MMTGSLLAVLPDELASRVLAAAQPVPVPDVSADELIEALESL